MSTDKPAISGDATGPFVPAFEYLVDTGQRSDQHMPLARYFSFVGGVLLALLFILDAYLPKIPVDETAHANLPVIRILTERKWPERIVFDTSVPTIVPAQIASGAPNILPSQAASDVSVKARGHEAFAQMQPPDAKLLQPPSPKKRELKLQRKSRIARKYSPSHFTSARQWQFGWFGQSVWRGG
jgi:hypothetical protein